MKLSKYESAQLKKIEQWKRQSPSIASQVFTVALSPLTILIQKLIPTAAVSSALKVSSSVAGWLTDSKDILRDSGMADVQDLKTHDLETSDKLANSVHNWAIGVATTEGGVVGAVGLPALVVDIPVVIVLALRVIHKIGVCYGFEVTSKGDKGHTGEKEFILAILAESGANDMEEKLAALAALSAIETSLLLKDSLVDSKTDAEHSIVKEAGIISIKSLARQIGMHLTKRKALQAIPVLGTLVGASVNGWYIKEVGWSARRAYQARWLLENKKITIS